MARVFEGPYFAGKKTKFCLGICCVLLFMYFVLIHSNWVPAKPFPRWGRVAEILCYLVRILGIRKWNICYFAYRGKFSLKLNIFNQTSVAIHKKNNFLSYRGGGEILLYSMRTTILHQVPKEEETMLKK